MKKSLIQYIGILEDAGLVREYHLQDGDGQKEVSYLSYDSNDMKEGGLFICKGAHFKSQYLQGALDHGAFCYLSQETYMAATQPSYILVTDIRKAMALLANAYYGEAWKALCLLGVTGTKGKSTVTYYVRSILDDFLEAQGKPKSAVISGIDNYDGVIEEESHLTTPEAVMLHRHFRNAVDSGIEYLEMEVSSQALRYDRTLGITYDAAAFLNIGEDHISPSEHRDFDDYFEAKLMLFRQCRTAVVNIDAGHSEEVCRVAAAHADKLITFGQAEAADVRSHHIVKTEKGIRFLVDGPGFSNEEFHIAMPGLFNVENAMAAISLCLAAGVPLKYMKSGLGRALVPGRMEVFYGEKSGVTVIVDYAHNRLSFEKLYTSAVREYPGKKIVGIYGCPGGKAFKRRQELGEVAGKYAQKLYITEEDAGEEPVEAICREIAQHLECPYEILTDRGEAIRVAIENGDKDTLILLTGKGRETRQKRGTAYVDCPSDVEYTEMYLK